MNSLLEIAFLIVAALVMALCLVALVGIGTWYLVYYVIGCKVAPIQKTVVTAVIIIWVIFGAIISLL